MTKNAILKKFKEELKESHQNFLDGKCKPWENFDWGKPMRIAEAAGNNYRADENP